MRKNRAKSYRDAAAGIVMLALFAVGMIAALISGAAAYRRIVKRDTGDYDARISTQYISERIKSAACGEVSIIGAEENGFPVLAVKDGEAEERCATYIYCKNGWLCELYTYEEAIPDFDAGDRLLELKSLEFKLTGTLLEADIVTADGLSRQVFSDIEYKAEGCGK